MRIRIHTVKNRIFLGELIVCLNSSSTLDPHQYTLQPSAKISQLFIFHIDKCRKSLAQVNQSAQVSPIKRIAEYLLDMVSYLYKWGYSDKFISLTTVSSSKVTIQYINVAFFLLISPSLTNLYLYRYIVMGVYTYVCNIYLICINICCLNKK